MRFPECGMCSHTPAGLVDSQKPGQHAPYVRRHSAFPDLLHHNCPRWEIVLKRRFTSPPHITEDRLLKVPAQQGGDDTNGIIMSPTNWIQNPAMVWPGIWLESLDFESVVRVHREGIIIPEFVHGFSEEKSILQGIDSRWMIVS